MMSMSKFIRQLLELPEKRKPSGPATTPLRGTQAPYKLEPPPVVQPLKPVK